MTRKPRVFIINDPVLSGREVRSLASVSRLGEIQFVFTENDPEPSKAPHDAVEHADQVLEDCRYDGKVDYLLWAGGDPLALALVAAICHELNEVEAAPLRILKWSRGINAYEAIELPTQPKGKSHD